MLSVSHPATLLAFSAAMTLAGASIFLEGKDIQYVMHTAYKAAYPDATHYMHIKNITRLVSHSNRVTAAVALHAAGLSIEYIAYRLRWKAASVETYLRECYHKSIGDVTQKQAITHRRRQSCRPRRLILARGFSPFLY
jgi:DNA-binding NarL/FixJ family response regulator